MVGKDDTAAVRNLHGIEPALADLIAELDATSLERVVVHAILEHRRLLDVAQNAFESMTDSSDHDDARRDAYVCAMLNSKVQTAVVAFLVDRLGYVPDVPKPDAGN